LIRQINDVLFDLGNVLVRFDWDVVLRRLTPYLSPKFARLLRTDREAFKKLFHEPGVALESGRIGFDKFHRIMSDCLAIKIEKEEFYRIWCDIFQPDDDMAILGKELSKRYGTWLVSNTSEAHYQWIINKFPQILFFRGAALSYELGVMKPSEEYYSRLIQKFGIDPFRAVFIDDIQENVDGAINAGIAGIVFHDKQQLMIELEKLGVKA
jgi:HAD superfamily hydrolase (TIGR01509 family)